MTMPTLVQNYKKKETVTRLKKVYSVMNQAIQMSSAVNGEPKDWVIDCGGFGSVTCSAEDLEVWFKNYLGKYLQVAKTDIPSGGDNGLFVYLNDGIIVHFAPYFYDIGVYLDSKALNSPVPGRNKFDFWFSPVIKRSNPDDVKYYPNNGATFEPYSTFWDGTRDGLLNGSVGDTSFGCANERGRAYCAKLIMYDGWEIKDDYPVKF